MKIKDKRLLIAALVVAAVLLIVAIGVVITLFSNSESGETVDGRYYGQLSGIGESYYEFNGDGNGKRFYTSAAGSNEEEFTYDISNGKITFTVKPDNKTETYPYGEGTYLGKDAIYINDEPYCKK